MDLFLFLMLIAMEKRIVYSIFARNLELIFISYDKGKRKR